MANEFKTYSLSDLEKILKHSRRTLYKYIQDGILPAVKIGREWRVSEEELRKLLTPKK